MADTSAGGYVVKPVYDDEQGYAMHRPYIVHINGKPLMRQDWRPRRYKDSVSAAVAGAKEVDRIKAEAS